MTTIPAEEFPHSHEYTDSGVKQSLPEWWQFPAAVHAAAHKAPAARPAKSAIPNFLGTK